MAEESQVVEKEEVVGKCCDVCTDDSCGTRRSHVVKIDDENGVSQSYRLSEYLGEIKYHSYLAPCEPHPIEQGDECFCEVRSRALFGKIFYNAL